MTERKWEEGEVVVVVVTERLWDLRRGGGVSGIMGTGLVRSGSRGTSGRDGCADAGRSLGGRSCEEQLDGARATPSLIDDRDWWRCSPSGELAGSASPQRQSIWDCSETRRNEGGDDSALREREGVVSDTNVVVDDVNESVRDRLGDSPSSHGVDASSMTLASTSSISAGDMICCGIYSGGMAGVEVLGVSGSSSQNDTCSGEPSGLGVTWDAIKARTL